MTGQEGKQASQQICKGRAVVKALYQGTHAWLEPAAALGPTVILGKGLGEEAPEPVGVQRPEV